MPMLGLDVPRKVLDELFDSWDPDGSGSIEMNELMQALREDHTLDPKLRAGGVLTFCNLTSLGVLKGDYNEWKDLFRETQLPQLLHAGWRKEELAFDVVPVAPPPGCEYYSHSTALVPRFVKAPE